MLAATRLAADGPCVESRATQRRPGSQAGVQQVVPAAATLGQLAPLKGWQCPTPARRPFLKPTMGSVAGTLTNAKELVLCRSPTPCICPPSLLCFPSPCFPAFSPRQHSHPGAHWRLPLPFCPACTTPALALLVVGMHISLVLTLGHLFYTPPSTMLSLALPPLPPGIAGSAARSPCLHCPPPLLQLLACLLMLLHAIACLLYTQ